jgi:hypothetical protein
LLLLVLSQALLVLSRLLRRCGQPVKLLLLLLLQHAPELAARRNVCCTGQQQLQLTTRLNISSRLTHL